MPGRRSFLIYTQRFNKKHQRVGYDFKGRYQVILVDKGDAEKAAFFKKIGVRYEK